MTSSRSTQHSSRRRLSLQAWALEPRMMFDAAAVATVAAVVDATASTPGVTATPAEATITIDDDSGAQSVDLFSDVSVTLDDSSDELSSLVITVNSSGSNQALLVDGTSIALTATATSGTTANSQYTYAVAVSGGNTIITLSINSSETGYTAAGAASLIDNIAYQTLDNTVESGTVTVTLTSLSDDGGDTATLNMSSTIAITSSINVAPTLSDDGALEAAESFTIDDLGDDVEVVYSSDGDYAYVAGDGAISVFSVDDNGRLTLTSTLDIDGLGTVADMAISPDNSSIYLIDATSGSVYVVSAAEDGSLSLAETVVAGDTTRNIVISDDGAYVYVTTEYNGMTVFSRNSSTGALTVIQTLDESSLGVVRAETVISANGYVYVVGDATSFVNYDMLTVLKIGDDGTLTVVDTVQVSATRFSSSTFSMAVSADADYLYLGNSADGTLQVYGFDGSTLTLMVTQSLDGVADLSLSSDGSLLYAVTSSGTINVYATSSTGNLTLTSSISGAGNVSDIAVSRDGLSILVVGSGSVTRYTSAQTFDQGSSVAFADGMTLADSNFDVLNDGAGNYNGASITVSANVEGGTFGFEDGNGLIYADGVISLNGAEIATVATSSDGVLTVTFTADVATAAANQVLQQLTYANASATVGSYILLTVAASDGALASNSVTVTLRVNSAPQVNTDVAAGYSLGTTTSETAYSYTLFSGLFDDADGDSLTWTVTGLPEGLSFDAKTLTISGSALETGDFTATVTVTDASGTSASLDLALTVAQIANRVPTVNEDAATTLASATEGADYSATLDGSLFSDADSVYGDSLTWTVTGLPDGFTFDAETLTISGSSSAVGDYTFTVTVTDESGATASVEMTLRVISTNEANNSVPSLSADADVVVYSSDGTLSGYDYYVNSITLSDDGTLLVIAGSTGTSVVGGNSSTGDNVLSVYSRNTTTGELTLIQTYVQGTEDDGDASNGIEVDGLNAITSVTFSADGKYLYVAGYDSDGSATSYTVVAFSVGEDGALSLIGSIDNVAQKIVDIAMSSDGDVLFVLSTNTLYTYTRGDDGSLTLKQSLQPIIPSGTQGFNAAAKDLSVDANGTVYAISNGRMAIYAYDADSDSLTYQGMVQNSGGIKYHRYDGDTYIGTVTIDSTTTFSTTYTVTAAGDGNVYVTTYTNYTLLGFHYDVDSNTLTLVSNIYTASPSAPLSSMVSADGSALYVSYGFNNTLNVYSIGDDGSLTLASTVTASTSRIYRILSTSDGQVLVGSNVASGSTGLDIISASNTVKGSYTETSTSRPLSAITLADADYDALNDGAGNYNGATFSIARNGGADSSDSYGFADGNSLTLKDGVLYLDGAAIATFTSADGTLTLTFTADVSTATANLVLQQITYTNASADPGSSITLLLSVTDQYASASIAIQLSVTEINDAPTLATTGGSVVYTSGGHAVKLFDDSVVSTIENGQTVNAITLTVSGLTDGVNETLSAGGVSVTLTDGASASGSITVDDVASSYTLTVSVAEDGVATVTISGSLSAEAAAALIDSIAYANTSDSPDTAARTVTLTAIQDSGGTDNGGVDTTTLTVAATVTVSLTNAAPSLTATGASASYTENGAAVTLFDDVTLSTGEAGQAISAVTLTVSGLSDGDSETLTIDGTVIALVASSGTTASGYSYTVTLDGATATVTLSSDDGIAVDDAAALLAAIAYANNSEDPTVGARTVALTSLQDDGGTANGGSDTANLSIAATVDVIAVNDAPVLSAAAATVIYTESGVSVTLFSGTAIDTVESSQNVSAISLTVTGVSDGASETLTIDSTAIALVTGSGMTDSGYSYTVTVDADSGDVTVIVSSDAGIATDAAAALIDAVTYTNASSVYTAGARSFTLSVRDSGGTNNGGVDAATLAASATVSVVENDAPMLGSTPDNEVLSIVSGMTSVTGLNDIAASALSGDGDYLYVVSSDGSIAIFSRNASSGELVYLETLASGLDDVSDILMSDDGSTVYVLGEDGDAIAIFSRAANDGSLTLTQTLATENVAAFAVSADGSAIYVVDGNYSGLLVYTLDADSGEYAQTQKIAASTSSEPYLFTGIGIQVVGDYVYVVTNPVSDGLADTLIVYQRDSEGVLTAVAYLQNGATDGEGNSVSLSDPLSIVVSSDGGTVYVASADGVSIFSFDAVSSTLTYVGAISDLSGVTAIALAGDDDSLYVTSSDGTIGRYDVSGDEAVLLQTLSADTLSGARDITVASNGAVVAAGSGGLTNLQDSLTDSLTLTYTEQSEQIIAGALTLADADYDALNDGAGNYNGATISVARSGGANGDDGYGFADGNGLTLTDGVIYYNGAAIASFVSNGGALTVTFISDATTTEIANWVLQQITYTNASDDPAAGITLVLTVTDAYDATDSVELALAVTAVNDAPTLTSTVADAVYAEGSTAVALFSGTAVSTVEAGQTITSLTLTVSGVSDGVNETLTVDGGEIALIAGTGVTVSGYSYVVTVDGDAVTLTIGSADGISATVVAALVDGIAYANASDDPTEGARTVTLTSVRDSGGSADGGLDTTTLSVAASVRVIGVNDAPTASSTPNSASYTAGDAAVTLFDGTIISVVEAGQSITALTVTVSGVVDDAESLTVDGTPVMLADGVSVTTASGLNVTVSLDGDIATLVISRAAGLSAGDAATLIDGLAYANTSTIVTAAERTITFAAAQDDGGTDNGGADTGALNIAATVTILNSAPQATDSELALPTATQAAAYGTTLSADLFSDVNGDSLTWSVSGLPSGLSFNADTRTISGKTIAVGSFELTVTVSDGQGGTATRVVTLTVDKQAVAPVVFNAATALGMMEQWMNEQEEQRREGELRAPSRPAMPAAVMSSHLAAPAVAWDGRALSRENYPLAGGAIDYAATPWQLDTVMTSLMPTLEQADFSSLRTTAIVPAQDDGLPGLRAAQAGETHGKEAFSAQLRQERAAFDDLLTALNQLTESVAPPAE